MKEKLLAFLPSFNRLCLGMFLGVFLLLTGCVRYDLGVNFQHQHGGAIVQHIRLGEQLTSLGSLSGSNSGFSPGETWLASITQRTQQITSGKIKQISPEEVVVTIPFSNGKQLVSSFNQFFNPREHKASQLAKLDSSDLVQLQSDITLNQSNLLFLERNKLRLQVDLRPLGVLSDGGNVIIGAGEILDLQFQLHTPWGAKSDGDIAPLVSDGGHQLVWRLETGKINDIEAVFWLPSYLGIGTLVIVLLMVGGFYWKYKHFPGFSS